VRTLRVAPNITQALIDNLLVLYKICNDVYVCCVCSQQENELVIAELLEGVYLLLVCGIFLSLFPVGVSRNGEAKELPDLVKIRPEIFAQGFKPSQTQCRHHL